jgi:hypothetical protein
MKLSTESFKFKVENGRLKTKLEKLPLFLLSGLCRLHSSAFQRFL